MKITIIIPSYNSSKYIEETLHSIFSQDYSDLEVILVDGKSSDDTISIANRFPINMIISEPDKGQSDAINKGFRKASGDVIAWQNADDLYRKDTFQIVSDFFETDKETDIIYGNYNLIDSKSNYINRINPPKWNKRLFSYGRFVPMQPTVFWRKKVVHELVELDTTLHYCMDVDFFARASNKFAFKKIDKVLGEFRVHEESKTQSNINNKLIREEHLKVLAREYNYNPLDDLIFKFFFHKS